MLLQPNTIFDNHYTLIRQLGRGGFSEVWLAHDSYMDIDVAIKIYAPGQGMDSNSINEFRREITGVFQLNHPNLLCPKHLGIWENMPYLIMAYCPAGSCLKFVGNISESEIWHLIHDVAAGLAYLHEKDIVHQDIKPDNILIDTESNYLITDFGISTRARSTLRKSVMSTTNSAGTLAYMGPERFSTQPAPTKASDIWSLGAMLYELLEGVTPFPPDFGGSMLNAGAAIPTINAPVSENLKQTIYKMLSKETWDRPTATTLVEWAKNPSAVVEKPSRPTKRQVEPQEVKQPTTQSKHTPQETSKKPKYGVWFLVFGLIILGIGLLVSDFNIPSSTKTSTPKQVAKPVQIVNQNKVKQLIADICASSSRGANYHDLVNYYTDTISPYVYADNSRLRSEIAVKTKNYVENYPEYKISAPYNFQFVNNSFPQIVECDVDVTWTKKDGTRQQAKMHKTFYITSEYKASGFTDKEVSRKTLIQRITFKKGSSQYAYYKPSEDARNNGITYKYKGKGIKVLMFYDQIGIGARLVDEAGNKINLQYVDPFCPRFDSYDPYENYYNQCEYAIAQHDFDADGADEIVIASRITNFNDGGPVGVFVYRIKDGKSWNFETRTRLGDGEVDLNNNYIKVDFQLRGFCSKWVYENGTFVDQSYY